MTDHLHSHARDSTAADHRPAAREALIAGLRNAHALERQGVAVMETQLGRLDDYPDLHARLTEHVRESREQSRRLEGALEDCGASTSMVKDALMSALGLSQSSVQGFARDAVLKAVLADTMFEHLEIAAYRSLFVLAEMAELPKIKERLQPSLDEEIAMAGWLEDNLEAVTRRYVELSSFKGADSVSASGAEPSVASEAEPTETPWYAKPQPGSAASVTGREAPAAKPAPAAAVLSASPPPAESVGMTSEARSDTIRDPVD